MKKRRRFKFNVGVSNRDQADATLTLATKYIQVAALVLEKRDYGTLRPLLYLYMHALELLLKAFLFSRHVTENELRKLGHDLVLCMRLCREKGLQSYLKVPYSNLKIIIRMNKHYHLKEFEYFMGAISFMKIEEISETIDLTEAGVRFALAVAPSKMEYEN